MGHCWDLFGRLGLGCCLLGEPGGLHSCSPGGLALRLLRLLLSHVVRLGELRTLAQLVPQEVCHGCPHMAVINHKRFGRTSTLPGLGQQE